MKTKKHLWSAAFLMAGALALPLSISAAEKGGMKEGAKSGKMTDDKGGTAKDNMKEDKSGMSDDKMKEDKMKMDDKMKTDGKKK
ncbi:MAG: hypothetical protein WCH75_23690 [Candidatus Binatia bacterium]